LVPTHLLLFRSAFFWVDLACAAGAVCAAFATVGGPVDQDARVGPLTNRHPTRRANFFRLPAMLFPKLVHSLLFFGEHEAPT